MIKAGDRVKVYKLKSTVVEIMYDQEIAMVEFDGDYRGQKEMWVRLDACTPVKIVPKAKRITIDGINYVEEKAK